MEIREVRLIHNGQTSSRSSPPPQSQALTRQPWQIVKFTIINNILQNNNGSTFQVLCHGPFQQFLCMYR